MAAVVDAPLSFEGVGKSEETMGEPQDAVIFVGISLVLGIACRHILKGTGVPYTVALLIAGIALGSIEYGTHHGLGKVGNGIRIWANINPDLLLSVFLPALLFESSFAMEVHQIKRCLMQMLLLAGPGVVISTFFLGTILKFTFPYGWDYKTSLLLGGLLSATDPVAVVALLKELGASKKISAIIEGESLMNDGTAIVVYQLFYKMVLGKSFNVGEIIQFLSRVSLGAVALGLAFGIVSVLWLGFIFNDAVIEIALTLAISYITFYTAQDGADVSGVLAVMTLGIFFAAVARTAFKGDSQQSLHHFWEMVSYIANTLIFILSGVVIAGGILNSDDHFERHGLKNTSFCHSGSCYHVETRSRVIFFDLGAAELDSPLQRRTVSRLSQSIEPVQALSREHESLLSWPENFFEARSSSVTSTPQTTLSARAMDLSIYGSTMNDMRRCFRSFSQSFQSSESHSLSYPRVPTGLTNARRLVSVQSEGGSMNRRLGSRQSARIEPLPPLPPLPMRREWNAEGDDLSDDSAEEVIVRIDSPSTLSFR